MQNLSPTEHMAGLQQQKKNQEAAKARKGQKAINKETRQQLQFKYLSLGQGTAAEQKGHWLRTTQINYAYPPSVTALASLKPITLSELRLETHHVGRDRTIAEPVRLQAVVNAIEDQNLEVDQLAVYNREHDSPPTAVLPKGAVFAIKEPYYKAAASGGYTVRVDHPSDIFQLDSANALIPLALAPRLVEVDEDGVKFKNAGNAAYKQQKYLKAVEVYTRGIAVCSDQDKILRHDLRRNRSIANFYLGRYEAAAKDDIKALYLEKDADEKQLKDNMKAL